jgi:hypothetical protein
MESGISISLRSHAESRLFLAGERKRMGMTDNNRRVRTKAYSVAVLAVELVMVSARSPAAQRKVLLLGKLQLDHWTPPYGRLVTAE